MNYLFKKHFIALFLQVFLTFTATEGLAQNQKKAFERGLIVLASPSMTNVMHHTLKEFSKKRNISIASTFNETEDLAGSIELGEPANIFISEDSLRMRDLQRKGVLNVFSLNAVASDKLVLVLPKKHYLIDRISKKETIEEKLEYVIKNAIVAITDPESDPSGRYTKQALEVMKLWKLAENKTIKTDNSRRSLYLSKYSNNPSIVYASDAKNIKNINIIGEIPQKYYDKIVYQAAIVAEINSNSEVDDSEEFVKYLKSKKVKSLLEEYGFNPM